MWLNWKPPAMLVLGLILWSVYTDCIYQTVLAPILPNLLLQISANNTKGTTYVSTNRQSNITSNRQNVSTEEESTEIGILFSVKAFVQIIISPFTGHFATQYGYDETLLLGLVIIFVSSTLFAYGFSFWMLFFSKVLHGVGSSCIRVASLGTLAHRYTDEKKREAMLGLVLASVVMGEVTGLLLGGFTYELLGQVEFFLQISMFVFVGAVLQCLLMKPNSHASTNKTNEVRSGSLSGLILDPYIIIVAGCAFLGNIQFSMLQSSLPIYMKENMSASTWQTGVVFLPQCASYLVGVIVLPHIFHKRKRWNLMQTGLSLITISYILILFATNFCDLLFAMLIVGVATAMVDETCLSELAHIADIRHTSVYAKIYSISEFAVWLGYAVGPAVGGILMNKAGFSGIMVGSAILCFAYIVILHCTDEWFPLKVDPIRLPLLKRPCDQS